MLEWYFVMVGLHHGGTRLLPGVQHLRVLRMFHLSRSSHPPRHLPAVVVVLFVFGFVLGWLLLGSCFSCFASAWVCFDLLPASSR